MRSLVVVCGVVLVVGCGKKSDHSKSSSAGGAKESSSAGEAKAKTSEAQGNLRKMYDGAKTYYVEEFSDRETGAPIPRQFPASAGPTPPLGTCCKDGGQCKENSAQWQEPTWLALQFSVDDPHYYSYEIVSSGSANQAAFTIRAYGDLDCDGTYSTFEAANKVTAEGELLGGLTIRIESEQE